HIKGGKVVVKTLPAGTRFTTLDNKERTLQATDLMICDAEEGMCIGGIFGGLHSGITETTTRVFLECAHFSSQHVRRTALHHGLKTDASFRHERGTDPEITVYALKRAALLMKEIAGVEISSDIIDLYPSPIQRKEIWVKDAHVNRLIGKVIAREEAFVILESLDIEIIEKQSDAYKVSVPQYRSDVVQEADVIEEILRIHGFDNVSLADAAKTDYLAEFPVNDLDKFKRSLGEMLTGNGFYEIWTNSLTNKAYQDRHELTFKGEPVAMLNKLSEEQGILRQTLLFTGLEVSAYNINRRQKDLRLYEFGKTYHKQDNRYDEVEMLALYMTGHAETENWRNATRTTDYYDLAQQAHQLLLKTGLPGVQHETATDQLFDYGVALKKGDTVIGKMGKVKASILKSFGIKQELFYAEFSTSLLFQAANPKLVIQEVAKFPEVRRDLSLVLDKRVTFDEIRKLVNTTEKRLVKNIITFDVYEGDKIPKGKKAYALGFTLLDEQKTLTDEEIDKTMARLMEAFEQQLGAHIRK
ncbi:MAG: phenylalanine--tRNA ligase subunit beta, partial [Bacteroidia bacterium]|nr:phenylalanine--tRNA ligase subunit beta [Bacteroidia bacterium]